MFFDLCFLFQLMHVIAWNDIKPWNEIHQFFQDEICRSKIIKLRLTGYVRTDTRKVKVKIIHSLGQISITYRHRHPNPESHSTIRVRIRMPMSVHWSILTFEIILTFSPKKWKFMKKKLKFFRLFCSFS